MNSVLNVSNVVLDMLNIFAITFYQPSVTVFQDINQKSKKIHISNYYRHHVTTRVDIANHYRPRFVVLKLTGMYEEMVLSRFIG